MLIVIAVLVLIGWAVVIVLGIDILRNTAPGRVTSGDQLTVDTIEWLRECEFVAVDEPVRYFYENTWNDNRGCLFSEQRIVSYSISPAGEWFVDEAFLSDVIALEPRLPDDVLDPIAVRIETSDFREFELILAAHPINSATFLDELILARRRARSLEIPGWNSDGSMALERQLEILFGFGIETSTSCTVPGLLQSRSRQQYEARPFDILLEAVMGPTGESPCSDDVVFVAAGCIRERGDYARLLRKLSSLADGAFTTITIEDNIDFARSTAAVTVDVDGVEHRWEAQVNRHWLDESILTRFAGLLDARASGRRFAHRTWNLELGTRVIICVAADALIDLRQQTGMDFHWLAE
jgi:hypothetical protein